MIISNKKKERKRKKKIQLKIEQMSVFFASQSYANLYLLLLISIVSVGFNTVLFTPTFCTQIPFMMCAILR
jgi:hypothetical protein